MSTIDTVREFQLPDLGEGLEDAEIVEWSVAVGDTVELNQVVCVVETAKATVDLPSPFAGRIVDRIGEPGETVPVGAVLVRVEVAGAEPAEPTGEPTGEAPLTDAAPPILVGYGPDESAPASRRRRAVPNEAVTEPGARAASAAESTDEGPGTARGARPLATPPVRRLARDLGVDLAAIAPGSGPGGAVVRDDVQRAAAANAASPQDGGLDGGPDGARDIADASHRTGAGTTTEIPVRGVRARIAERMTVSRATIPDASCGVEADCSRLLEIRNELRTFADERPSAASLTPFVLILRLVVAALRGSPTLNATFDGDAAVIRVHGSVHLGVALSTERGLLVPVVRDAEQRTTADLAREVARLAEAGRAGTLAPAELTGSTFTVSNFGAFGLDDGYPVINHPEAAILGVGAIRARAVVVDGAVVARPTVRLTCCFDHRVSDGAEAGAFLSDLRDLVESPTRLLLDA